jgi:pilus assembly protein Flp/PilA
MLQIHAALSSVGSKLRGFRRDDRGATAVEYGLMVALIAAVIAGVVMLLGQTLNDKFSNVNGCVNAPSASCGTTQQTTGG